MAICSPSQFLSKQTQDRDCFLIEKYVNIILRRETMAKRHPNKEISDVIQYAVELG